MNHLITYTDVFHKNVGVNGPDAIFVTAQESTAVRPGPVFATARDRQTVYLLVAGAVTFSVLVFWYVGRIGVLSDPMALREWLLGLGVLAPIAFITLQAIQVVVAPIPGQVLGIASISSGSSSLRCTVS